MDKIEDKKADIKCPVCLGEKTLPRMNIHGQGFWIKCWRCNGRGVIKKDEG